MSQPRVTANELQGALGAQPDGDPILVFVGPTTAGTVNQPAAFGRTKDLAAAFGYGPTVQAACHYIATYKRPAIIVKTAATVAATADTIVVSGITGTSVVTATAASSANDDYDLKFTIVNGGTIGVTGITYTESRDGGLTTSAVKALGVATTILPTNAGGVGFALGVGTLVAGDTATLRTHAPTWNSADIGAALAALAVTTYSWEIAHLVGPIDATTFAAIGTAWGSMPEKTWIGNTRVPNAGESEATYLAALNTIFSSLSTSFGCLCAGAAKIASGLDFNLYRRPVSHAVAAYAQSVSAEIDLAQIDLGALTGVQIRTTNGNVDEHDESANPGLDDARFTVLRTVDGEQGVFINNARIFSTTGSDFEFLQHRRVFNIFKRALRIYFQRRLSKPVVVNNETGFILEEEAVEIESGASSILADLLLNKPMASGGQYSLRDFVRVNRTDNLLSTKTMNVTAGMIPLAYPKVIIIDEGFYNPALQTVGG